MKRLFLLFSLTFTLGAQAQLQQSQTMYAILGGFERLFEFTFGIKSVPMPGYVLSYEDKDAIETLKKYSPNTDLRLPNLETTFAFTNTDKDFEGVFKKNMGVCRGYASLRRKFRFLAYFDKENVSGIEVPNRDTKKGQKQWLKFYKKIVQDIRDYKYRVIPGFANLQEMSSDPEVGEMMKWQVMYEWRDKNFSPGTGLGTVIKGNHVHSKYEELLSMRERIEKNAKLGHNTLVWLSERHSGWIHSLEAIEASPVDENGTFTITFWNDKFTQLDRAKSTLVVTGDNLMIYNDTILTRELNAGGVVRENDGEMMFMANKVKEFCELDPERCAAKPE